MVSKARSSERPVVVCGGGMAGLVAAVATVQAGSPVVLIEKAPYLGGSFRLSGGTIWAYADLDRLFREVPDGNPVLQELIHRRAPEDRAWLSTLGVKLSEELTVQGRGIGQSVDAAETIEVLQRTILDAGGEIRLNTGLDGLLMQDGQVAGVRAARDDGSVVEIPARAVVLATGGFQGNPSLLTSWIAPANNLHLRAAPWSTGDGLITGDRIGAAVTDGLNTYYGHALAAPPARFSQGEFSSASVYFGGRSVAVNLQGMRFADESRGTGEEELNRELGFQPEGRGYYIVDAKMAARESRPGKVITQKIVDRAIEIGAPAVVADSIDDLCTGLAAQGVSAQIRDTLDAYNNGSRDGMFAGGMPPRMEGYEPLDTPPFTAIGVKAGITFTMGGLRIDDDARVLRRTVSSSPIARSIESLDHYREAPIRGLFAAGCDVGGISHGGYAGGLSAALVMGRIAGTGAAGK